MTPSAFDRAVRATGSATDSRSTLAARLVLVDGLSQREAARLMEIDPAAVCRAVKRLSVQSCPGCGGGI